MVLSDTQDTTSKGFLVSCLISIFVTDDVMDLLGDCHVCGKSLEPNQVAILDWQNKLLLHNHSTECIAIYQEQYLRDYPDTTNMQMMILFGISLATAKRRRHVVGASNNVTTRT